MLFKEAHHISAKKFCKSFPLTGMRRILLLTGTPYRKDRSEKVAESWIGPVTFQRKRIYTRNVYVKVIDPIYEPLKTKFNFKKKPDYNLNLNDLVNINERNIEIIKQTIIMVDEGRQVLVLSDRCDKVQHLHKLQDILKEQRIDIKSAIFYGKTKKADRKNALTAQVIFSSYSMASEALDIPSLSVVALATPKSNVEQAIMRAIRGKYQLFDPVILYFRDNYGMWWKYWKAVYKFFQGEGFEFIYVGKELKNETPTIEIQESPFLNEKIIRKRKTDFLPKQEIDNVFLSPFLLENKKSIIPDNNISKDNFKPTLSKRLNKRLKLKNVNLNNAP